MVVHDWHCVTWLDRASGCMGVVNLYGSFQLSFVYDLRHYTVCVSPRRH